MTDMANAVQQVSGLTLILQDRLNDGVNEYLLVPSDVIILGLTLLFDPSPLLEHVFGNLLKGIAGIHVTFNVFFKTVIV